MVSTIKNGIVANHLEAIRQKWPHDFMNGWRYCNNVFDIALKGCF